ncbi:MAG: flagellar motor protein MotB [Acidimicrobiales bacterium]|nr:flagellar motor protein MotB [Acidimicrobiales bacterium]
MSGGGGAGGDPFHEEEEHENHERYLVTYADMITLLMALFIILFAMGQQADQEQFDRFRGGLAEAFDNPLILGTGGLVAFPSQAPAPVGLPADSPDLDGPTGHVAPEEADDLVDELEALLRSEGLDALTSVDVEADGVVVTIDTDGLVFASGSAAMLPAGDDIVAQLVRPFSLVTNRIVVQGHTDDVPMSGGMSNWELSANRAGAVLHRLIEGGIPADRLSMAGYADTRPVASNDTEEGRARNRRVDIVVVLDGPDPTSEVLTAIEPIGDPLTEHEG